MVPSHLCYHRGNSRVVDRFPDLPQGFDHLLQRARDIVVPMAAAHRLVIDDGQVGMGTERRSNRVLGHPLIAEHPGGGNAKDQVLSVRGSGALAHGGLEIIPELA